MNSIITDKLFGEVKNAETEVKWLDRKVRIDFSDEIVHDWNEEQKIKEIKGAIEKFKILFWNQEEWDKKMKDEIVENMLELAEDWLMEIYYDYDENQMNNFVKEFSENSKVELTESDVKSLKNKVLTKDLFRENIYLQAIHIGSTGNFSAYYYDDELFFAGHVIELMGNVNGEFRYEPDIVG